MRKWWKSSQPFGLSVCLCECECVREKRLHLSSTQRHRWKEIILHSVHGTNYILKHLFVSLCIDHLDLQCNHVLYQKVFRGGNKTRQPWWSNLMSSFILYPNTEEGADRLVVAGLQLHVTPVFQLVNIVSSPKDSVTPGRHAALPTAEINYYYIWQICSFTWNANNLLQIKKVCRFWEIQKRSSHSFKFTWWECL